MFKNFFNKKSKEIAVVEDATMEKKVKEEVLQAGFTKSVYGKNSSGDCEFNWLQETKREDLFCKKMDAVLKEIKDEKSKKSFLSRTVHNIVKGALKEGYYFYSHDPKVDKSKIKKVQERFEDVLYASKYEPRQFVRDILYNLVSYSNAFIIPMRSEKGGKMNKIERLLIAQNIGWEVKERFGPLPVKWRFEPGGNFGITDVRYSGSSTGGTEYKNETIWHMTFNKESDEVFGVPLWVTVIPDLRKYVFLLDEALDSYEDQGVQKIVYSVGADNSGKRAAYIDPATFGKIRNTIEDSGENDMVINAPVKIDVVKKDYSDPSNLLAAIKGQVVSGLHTSESQLGLSGAGRQDAETQQDSTNSIIEDFQENLEDWLNITLIREICIELFGDYSARNRIKFKFSQTFNDQERKEKHETFLFQSGGTDHDEYRTKLGRSKDQFSDSKSFFKKFQEKEMGGTVASKGSPKNQHTGKAGTGTTKKSKKT